MPHYTYTGYNSSTLNKQQQQVYTLTGKKTSLEQYTLILIHTHIRT